MNKWHLSQVFGGDKHPRDVDEADIVSAISVDKTGKFLAAGDKSGRMVLFKENTEKNKNGKLKTDYRFYTEFQSHEVEFDRLKSVEIEGKINKIEFLPNYNASTFLLTTNDKTIKLWKVYEKTFLNSSENSKTARVRHTYRNAHNYSIHSIAMSNEMTSFLSADELTIHLWDIETEDTCMNMIDLSPDNIDDVSEVITSASFDSTNPIFGFGTSRGLVRLGDLRVCPRGADLELEYQSNPDKRSMFNEVLSSVSDIRFLPFSGGRRLVTRDYLSLKLWDVAMPSDPVAVIPLQPQLHTRLSELYANDTIFDRFDVAMNGDGTKFAAGTYNGRVHILSKEVTEGTPNASGEDVQKQIDDELQSYHRVVMSGNRFHLKPVKEDTVCGKVGPKSSADTNDDDSEEGDEEKEDFEEDEYDDTYFDRKTQCVAYHPKKDICFTSVLNNLYIFTNQ